MKIALRSHPTKLAGLNVTPLLDLVFVLLVIFIITTPQMMNNLELVLPSTQPEATTQLAPMRICVLGNNHALLDSQEFTLSKLKTELQLRKAKFPFLSATVQGADDADYQTVVDVLEILHLLGVSQVGLTTAAVNSTNP